MLLLMFDQTTLQVCYFMTTKQDALEQIKPRIILCLQSWVQTVLHYELNRSLKQSLICCSKMSAETGWSR